MNAELIAVGTELLLGDTINTDAAAVARLLSELGINVYWQTVVGDNRARLEQAVQLARTRADLIIRPRVGDIGPAEFEQRQRAILEGEKAALAALPQLRAKVAQWQQARMAERQRVAKPAPEPECVPRPWPVPLS